MHHIALLSPTAMSTSGPFRSLTFHTPLLFITLDRFRPNKMLTFSTPQPRLLHGG